jgi:hypothetical protein
MKGQIVSKLFAILSMSTFLLCSCWSTSSADTIFNDGQNHTVNYTINDTVSIANSLSNGATKVTLETGGTISGYKTHVYDNSNFIIAGGNNQGYVCAFNNSKVEISSGTIRRDLIGAGNSLLNVTGGSIATDGDSGLTLQDFAGLQYSNVNLNADLEIRDNAFANINSGYVKRFLLFNNALANINGGTIDSIHLYQNSIANIKGGSIGRILIGPHPSWYEFGIVNIFTKNLTGEHVAKRTFYNTGGNYSSYRVQEYLLNGDYINTTVFVYDGSILVIIPDLTPIACIAGGNQTVEAQGSFGATVTLDGSCSGDGDSTTGTNDDVTDFNWYEIIDPCNPDNDIFLGSGQIIDCNLPLGEHAIILEVTDKAGESDANEITITIEDTTSPDFELSVSPATLRPVNRKMIKITPTFDASDLCDPSPQVSLVDITANEPANPADIKISDDGSIYLCATRSGNNKTGRIYTLTYEACDSSDNCTTRSATVVVPHDSRK